MDTKGRTLHFWPEDGAFHKVFPVSVPLTEDLTRLGRTSVVRKRIGPDWRPTPSMLSRNPDLPDYIGPGQIIRLEHMRFTLAGNITASMEPMTRARSGGSLQMGVLAYIMTIFRSCSNSQK